jgi:hypothetical protein
MVYDSVNRCALLFGGYGSSGYLGDTWEWISGFGWLARSVTGTPARTQHAMAFDSQRGRTVLFGGLGSSGYLSDTWEYDFATANWLPQIFASGPIARFAHAMAYDIRRGRTVMFGGQDSAGVPLGDTWEWDGTNWMQMVATGPSARYSHRMAYDGQRAYTVLSGGYTSGGAVGETWGWNGTSWTQAPNGVPSRAFHAMAYDSQRGRLVLFGGLDYSGIVTLAGDTWELVAYGNSFVYGNGCGIPPLELLPVANAQPIINTTAQAALNNIPSSIAFVALGWSNTAYGVHPLPLTLAGFGLPGCSLQQSSEFAALPVSFTSASTATFSLPLPNITGLIGLRCFLQGWAYAPGVNPGHTIVSNGVEWDIGF